MRVTTKLLENVTSLLADRLFTEQQIKNIVPRLTQEFYKEPKHLAEIIDTWNIIMTSGYVNDLIDFSKHDTIPPPAVPPKHSLMGSSKINMNNILGDIEPGLLLFDPHKLVARNKKVNNLSCINNLGEHWILLYNAPTGFYLQDWLELSKKIYYIETHLLDFLYDKKEQKNMLVHPLVKSAAVVEADFDHIRTRFLFASRSGYKTLSHLYSVQTALQRPTLKDIILVDDATYLKKFAPYCTLEEYSAFSNLIKNFDLDEDDAEIFEKLAELEGLKS